ncbi:MAG TPA: class III signal peptide-containing protein [archaeon]|nr:class III signal peptide-containing protein [archaeon]
MNKRGQGTIEYLVIIAIVVVIALVVVGLLLQILENFGGIGDSTAEGSWKMASPWSLTNSSTNNGTLSIALKNLTADTLQFNKMCLGPSEEDCNSTPFRNVGPSQTIIITLDNDCSAGEKYSFLKEEIYIDYNRNSLTLRQLAPADLSGNCN